MRPLPALPPRTRRAVERVTNALRRRIQRVQDREEAAARHRWSNHYLIRAAGTVAPPTPVPRWTRRTVGGYDYHLHPGTPVTFADRVVIIGRPVDVDGASTDAEQIALRLSTAWTALNQGMAGGDTAGEGTAGEDAVQQLVSEAARLAGRWVIVLHHNPSSARPGALTVLTDAQASVPVVARAGTAAVSSHPEHLPGHEATPAGETTPAREAIVTVPHHSWLRLTPDAAPADRLTLHRHRDPSDQVEAPDPEALYAAFRDRFVTHVRLLTELGTPVISLTGGLRSRATLAAYLQHRRPGELALTFYDPESARTSTEPAADLFAASDLAYRVGLPHRVLRPHDSLASVLPPDAVELRSSAVLLATDPEPVVREPVVPEVAHEVLLPFNDRVLAELWHSAPAQWRSDEVLLQRLADEAPSGAH